jgi:hypothetical protein
MRDAVVLLSILGLVVVSAFAADDVPQRLAFDRYTAMVTRSPFSVATAVAMPAATPNFAKDLYVANAAHVDTGDLVTVLSASDKSLREYLSTEEPNPHGYAISNIQWSDKPGETKVTITKDGQFATLTFNQALLQGPVSANAPIPPPSGMPNGNVAPTAQANIPRPPPPQGVNTMPTPHVRGLIQRNPPQGPVNVPQAEQ